jgi:hypothetical protein
MHSSLFSYSISRPWPFKWFTPTVVVGGVVATIFFSILNFISSGYSLTVQYSRDPNTTTSQIWFNHWPSFLTSKIQPTCQAVNLPINTELLTNNTALTYSLTAVYQGIGENSQNFSSELIYYNNFLQNCSINSIELRLQSTDRTASQIAVSPWGIDVLGYVTCNIDLGTYVSTFVNLTAEYNYVPDTASIYSGFYAFIGQNKETSASLYWGESLLSMHWVQLASDMHQEVPIDVWGGEVDVDLISQGVIYFAPNNGTVTDFMDTDYFDVGFRFIVPRTDNTYQVIWNSQSQNISFVSGEPISGYTPPDIWSSADRFVKSFHSTILTDLGQISSSPNILTNATLLEHFTSDFSQILDLSYHESTLDPGPAKAAYTPLDSTMGALGVRPSVLSAEYLCQVPRQKPTGDMLVAVLIADLVLLQALWQVFKLVVGGILTHQDRKANFCKGCLNQQLLDDVDEEVTSAKAQHSASGDLETILVESHQSLISK